jgi:subtilase family serine protease
MHLRRRRARAQLLGAAALVVVAALTACSAPSHVADAAPLLAQPAPRDGKVTFYLSLPGDRAALRAAAKDVADPSSPKYRHFVSIADAGARYGASDADLDRIAASVTSLGLGFFADPSRLFARVNGTVDQWQQALGSPLSVTAGTKASPFTTYTLPSSVPDALQPSGTHLVVPVAQVYDASTDGSRPTTGKHPTVSMALTDGFGSPFQAHWPTDQGTPYEANCSTGLLQDRLVLTPAQVQTAYGVDELKKKVGDLAPVVTVLDLGGGWSQADLRLAAGCWGYTAPTIDQAQGDGVPDPIANADDETTLDLQTIAAVVPGAELRLVQTVNGGGAFLDGFSRAVGGSTLPDAISVSYGACAIAEDQGATEYVRTVDALLQQIALAGVGTFIAAGDSGSTTCGTQVKAPTVSFPATSAFVTAVGGSRITLGSGNALVDEVVWNDAKYGEKAAGGGGASTIVPRPWYQTSSGEGTTRTLPDVTAQAAIVPGWPIVLNQSLQTVGGTSGATPFTAAAYSLVSAAQRAEGKPALGLANGWFYAAAATPGVFRDVTVGSNDLEGVGCCTAAAGYDRASGLGSPVWSSLPATLPEPGRG